MIRMICLLSLIQLFVLVNVILISYDFLERTDDFLVTLNVVKLLFASIVVFLASVNFA